MTLPPGAAPAEPFFLESGAGQRFCLFHPPIGACRGALLYVHPFGEEMNRSRRMAALQARELAALGYGVLQLDLYGCGDSSGDFGDARWELWKQDLAAGAGWLRERLGQPVTLWGLRLGALLALDYARGAPHPVAAVILWQPVASGAVHLTQFLRLRMAGELLADSAGQPAGTGALRAALQAGEVLEVGGYDLAPALAAAIDVLDAAELAPDCPVHWFEAVGGAGRALPPGAERIGAAWRQQGVELHMHAVHCPPFWSTPEITVCPALLAATSALFRVASHAV
jgi:exosortase A-associated hydrolase 2